MSNLNPIRLVGGLVLLGLASCSTSQLATQGETDNLYFMASDARVATEFAVRNNTPENFRDMGDIQPQSFDTQSFSNRNVNPEYIARYQRPSQPVEEGSVYFDDSANQPETRQGNGNVDAYDNFRGSNGNVTNNFFMNPMMGMGFGPMMGMGFGPMWGMGGFPMMGGFYDPFWGPGMGFYDPFWGPSFGMMGFRPGFNVGLGFGFGSPFMRTRIGFGNPWMMGGLGFYDPWMMGGGFFRPGFNNPIIIMPGGEGGRQIVRSARPTLGSSLASTSPRTRSAATQPTSSRSTARREAIGSNPNGRQTGTASSRNNFSRSQNDYYSNPRASAAPARRNISSPATSRPGSTTGTRSNYGAPSRVGSTSPRSVSSPTINGRSVNPGNTRSGYSAPSRSTSPSYNRDTRSTSPAYNNSRSSSPSYSSPRSTTPSRSSYSAPSRSSSPSFSAPSGGGSRGGGGGSVSGGRRGN